MTTGKVSVPLVNGEAHYSFPRSPSTFLPLQCRIGRSFLVPTTQRLSNRPLESQSPGFFRNGRHASIDHNKLPPCREWPSSPSAASNATSRAFLYSRVMIRMCWRRTAWGRTEPNLGRFLPTEQLAVEVDGSCCFHSELLSPPFSAASVTIA